MGLARKITLGIIGLLILVGALVGFFTYEAAYRQVDQSVGIELVGCANITTGLIDPADIELLAKGDTSVLSKVEERLNWTVDHKHLFKEAFILSPEGKILAADKHLKARGYKAGDSFYLDPEDRKAILSMQDSVYSKVYTYDGTRLKTGYGPIHQNFDHTQKLVGLMAINFDASIIQERTWEILIKPLVITAAVFLLAAVAVYFIVHRMIRPVTLLSERVNRIAEGDLTVPALNMKGKDEVGRLARDFDLMAGSLRRLLTEVNQTSLQVFSSSQQLAASSEQSGSASEQTVQVTLALQQGADKQLDSLKESSEAIQHMSLAINEIACKSEQAAAAAGNSAHAANHGAEVISDSIRQMNIMDEHIHQLDAIVADLSDHSAQIQSFLEIITEIAGETHLLALNAAIEAARAGEHGRGFAVVANSVRKLAERSASSAQQVNDLIIAVGTQMKLASESMELTAREVVRGTQLVRDAGSSFTTIDQTAKLTAESLQDVSGAVKQLSGSSEQLLHTAEIILQVAEDSAESAQTMSAASEEQLAINQEVESSAALLADLAKRLQELVDRFKI
ncbi:methyl-accepting chemotaxis protein [Paenibacillus sp. CAA11]|uniref:methyl-accepting chemotaxis protein n=1 Tax=Paenibacillus sp. CAA11 TaxID=1532905 RepID=UPI000D3AC2B4|nr:methyl-accepting chemotaxis protein [Paenibacillus sp. CAA11]AWB43606.1 methyl-accepting chemotaxis protein [Paenibacillus sp. CAA11]